MAGSPQLWTERPVHTTMSPRFLHSCHQGLKEIALGMVQIAKHNLSAMTTIQEHTQPAEHMQGDVYSWHSLTRAPRHSPTGAPA